MSEPTLTQNQSPATNSNAVPCQPLPLPLPPPPAVYMPPSGGYPGPNEVEYHPIGHVDLWAMVNNRLENLTRENMTLTAKIAVLEALVGQARKQEEGKSDQDTARYTLWGLVITAAIGLFSIVISLLSLVKSH